MVSALLVATACTPSPAPQGASAPTPATRHGAPTALLYLDGTELKSFDLATRQSMTITELPSADVVVSPDGAHLVAVQETHPAGPGSEGFRRPQLVIGSTSASEIPSELGPGRSPVWDESSTAVAAIVPTGAGETIVINDVPSGAIVQTDVPGDERWSLVGWMGDEVVAIGTRSGVIATPGNGGPYRALRVAPARLWGVSPEESAYLAVTDGGGTLISSGGRHPVNVDERVLGDGAWSWDGTSIAVTLVGGSRPQLVLVDATTGHVRQVAAGPGVQGNVVWAADSKTFAFARVDPDNRTRLQAMICTSRIDCSTTFSWGQGVRLLGFR